MDGKMDKQQVKAWKAGYDAFNRWELKVRRQESFADRLRAFIRVLEFGQTLPRKDRPPYDEAITARWTRIRNSHSVTSDR